MEYGERTPLPTGVARERSSRPSALIAVEAGDASSGIAARRPTKRRIIVVGALPAL
jgi:hypothetical protein